MSSGKRYFVQSPFEFIKAGQSGADICTEWVHLKEMVDDMCFYRGAQVESVNHPTACYHVNTGNRFGGDPAVGSWVTYGLGSQNQNLPGFVVLPRTSYPQGGAANWSNGYLPAHFQGTPLRPQGSPILDLNPPEGVTRNRQRANLDLLAKLNGKHLATREGRTDLEARMASYELAYRMQMSVPEVIDLSDEPEHVFKAYGEDARNPGTFAANCLVARRLAERGVRFIQLYHPGWDQHGNLQGGISNQARETDRASAALVSDLKQRGLLDDTLVIWGGEFGRTNYCQGKLTANSFGRDHHPRCFSIWMAGGGVKAGTSYGQTDPYCYNVAENGVHVHDLHATILHLMGIDHQRLTYKHQGRNYRLTDVHGNVVEGLLG